MVPSRKVTLSPRRTVQFLPPGLWPAFEKCAFVSQGAELVGCHQPCDPSAQDHCLHSFAGAWRRWLGLRSSRRHQTHALHHQERGAVSACPSYTIQEFPSANRHRICFPFRKRIRRTVAWAAATRISCTWLHPTTACAAFSEESRMMFADPTKLHRKSGGADQFD